MAKGNPLIGTLRGKVGDVVFSRQGGEQRSRAYIPTVKNPRTRSQMAQRVQLANIVATYRSVVKLFPSAFQSKPANQSDYNQFVSKNLGQVKVYLTKDMALAGACIIAPYRITQGTLTPIGVTGSGSSSVSNIALGSGFTIDDTTSVAALSQAIVANNPSFEYGMQLSYISVIQSTNPTTGYPMVQGYLYDLTLDPSNTDPARKYIPAFGLTAVNGYIGHGTNIGSGAFAWIKSQKNQDGKILVSSQSLILTATDLYNAYRTSSARYTAMASYGMGQDVFLNPESNEATAEDAGTANAAATISSVSYNDEALVSGDSGYKTFEVGKRFAIRGTNLSEHEVALNFITSATIPNDVVTGSVSVSDFLSNPATSDSVISGAVAAAKSNIRHLVVLIDGATAATFSWSEASFG